MGLRTTIIERLRSSRRTITATAVALAVATPILLMPPTASAQATIDHITKITDRREEIYVRSAAMGRIVQLDVLLPADQTAARPTLYLLDGNGATNTQTESTWVKRTDAISFFSNKAINVVMPVGGGGTFYSDWVADDPALGHNKWETFLTQELPPLMDAHLKGNGANGIAGLSMGAAAASILMVRNPSLYRALGAYSGCMIDSNLGQAQVRTVVASRGGNADNMWGGLTNPQWNAHDPSQHTDKLVGKAVYLSTGTGVPGPADLNFDPSFSYPVTLTQATALEQIVNDCTAVLDGVMRMHGVTATVKYNAIGTHSWPYWQDALHDSWPVLRAGLGV